MADNTMHRRRCEKDRQRGLLAGAAAVLTLLMAVSGCKKPGDAGEAAYEGPGPAKAGAPGMRAGAPEKPAAPARAATKRRS